MPVTTNLLALPLVAITAETGTNEDWVDALVFLVGGTDPALYPQLDIRGIDFEMEIRHAAPDTEVVLSASTKAGTMKIGSNPDNGWLIIAIPYQDPDTTHSQMHGQLPGKYVGDIRGSDDQNTRVCATIDLTIFEGITR